MTFLWPNLLWLLLLAPLLIAAYVVLLRRRKAAVRFSNLNLIKSAIGPGQRIRRHVPPALLLLSLVAMVVAIARPSSILTLPSQYKTIMLAIDVSLSMRATDVDPNRITAAQIAAKSFIEEMPPNVRIGIVSFGGSASLVQKPTTNRDELLAAIDRFQLQRGTATGSGLYVALATLFPDAGIDLESILFGSRPWRANRDAPPSEKSQKAAPKTPPQELKAVTPGSYKSAVVILLSDGRRTTGPDPLDAAKFAADRGVRVFTVGFGTLEGSIIGFEGWSAYVRLDEETLKAVADVTRAEYFHAGTAADLKKVYQELNSKLVLEKTDTEITALWSAIALLLAIAAGGLSVLWFNRSV